MKDPAHSLGEHETVLKEPSSLQCFPDLGVIGRLINLGCGFTEPVKSCLHFHVRVWAIHNGGALEKLRKQQGVPADLLNGLMESMSEV